MGGFYGYGFSFEVYVSVACAGVCAGGDQDGVVWVGGVYCGLDGRVVGWDAEGDRYGKGEVDVLLVGGGGYGCCGGVCVCGEAGVGDPEGYV
nr:hypothetical protein [Anaerohalosphaera lusitana]